MQKTRITTLTVFSLAVMAAIYSYKYEVTVASEPTEIIIESNSLGINSEPEVQKVYEVRKLSLKEALDKEVAKTTDTERLDALKYTFDSLECMESSMKQYQKLINVIDGDAKSAQKIYKEMEGNCVEDVLYYLKTNHPEKFVITHKAFLDSGFVVPYIED